MPDVISNKSYDALEIVQTGTYSLDGGTITYNNNTNYEVVTGGITHNLGFIPLVIAYYRVGETMFPLPLSSMLNAPSTTQGDYSHVEVSYSTTTTTLDFQIVSTVSGAGSGTIDNLDVSIVYYLLRAPAVR